MGPHILLKELGLEHRLEVANLKEGKDEFLKVNPRGKVPALITEQDEVITEQLGIDSYLAAVDSSKGLIPSEPVKLARVYEALAFANSSVHPPVGHIYFSERYVGDDEADKSAFVERAKARFYQALQQQEELIDGPYLLGKQFSAADAYLYVMYRWAQGGGVDLEKLPKLKALGETMEARPAVKAMLAAEAEL